MASLTAGDGSDLFTQKSGSLQRCETTMKRETCLVGWHVVLDTYVSYSCYSFVSLCCWRLRRYRYKTHQTFPRSLCRADLPSRWGSDLLWVLSFGLGFVFHKLRHSTGLTRIQLERFSRTVFEIASISFMSLRFGFVLINTKQSTTRQSFVLIFMFSMSGIWRLYSTQLFVQKRSSPSLCDHHSCGCIPLQQQATF